MLFLERRETPLSSLAESEVYDIAVEVVDRVGWNTGDKKGLSTCCRDPADDAFILDAESELILDSDFDSALALPSEARVIEQGATG